MLACGVRCVDRRIRKTAHTGIASDSAGHEILEFDDVRVDFTTMEAFKEGNLIAMTNTEFKLLQYLARTPGRVICAKSYWIKSGV